MVIGESKQMSGSSRVGPLRAWGAAIPSAWIGLIELTLGMATIASGFLASNVVTQQLPVMLASSVRYTIATLILLPVLLLSGPVPRLSAGSWRLLIGVALGGTLVFNSGLLYGLRYTTVVEAGIVTSTTPMLVGLFGLLFYRERLSCRSWGAIVVATFGVVLVIAQPGNGDGAALSNVARIGGLLLILMAASGEACFNVFGRRLPRTVSSVTASVLTMAIAIVLFLPGAVFEIVTGPPSPTDRDGWLAVISLAAIPSATGLLLWADGVRRVSLAVSGAVTALIPVFTSLFAVMFIGESLGLPELIGIAVIVLSLTLLARSSAREVQVLS